MLSTNIPNLYTDALYLLRDAPTEKSRNGPVKTIQEPVVFTVLNPRERVLCDPKRRANPYFHVMETVWMFAGMDDVRYLLDFNSRMGEYADGNIINGAYGKRWRDHFDHDQIYQTIRLLKEDPYSRQAVIAMWDPDMDGPHRTTKDRPCNTHLYFRRMDGALDMTVCNRSNDAIWGMAGANAVHMTYLQELIASALNWPVGRYHVMTNNLHIYEHHWRLLDNPEVLDMYDVNVGYPEPYPILSDKCDLRELMYECRQFMLYPGFKPKSNWLRNVAYPMREIYLDRLKKVPQSARVYESIAALDWREACIAWGEWHDN